MFFEGDKVRVKYDLLKIDESYGGRTVGVNPKMNKMCGKKYVINHAFMSEGRRLYYLDGYSFVFKEEMLSKVIDKKTNVKERLI